MNSSTGCINNTAAVLALFFFLLSSSSSLAFTFFSFSLSSLSIRERAETASRAFENYDARSLELQRIHEPREQLLLTVRSSNTRKASRRPSCSTTNGVVAAGHFELAPSSS